MNKQTLRLPKAYKDLDFLNSPDARSIRILSEFVGPLARFRRKGIRDTIVFFGSARIIPRNQARKQMKEIREQLKKSKRISSLMKQRLHNAHIDYSMSKYYDDAVELSSMLTRWSMNLDHSHHFVVCSGGGPGIMEAANKGASKAGGQTIGLNISIPNEQISNPYITEDLNLEFHYFFMRKFWFVYLAKALVLFPGGFGTLDELMEVLTLIQTKKVTKPLPIVLYGRKYWDKVVNFQEMINHRTISAEDYHLMTFVDTPEEAFTFLKSRLWKTYLQNMKRIKKRSRGT